MRGNEFPAEPAQKLHITQQSLSGHINKLETSFGVPLFDRKQPLTLTPAGMYLRKRAAEFLAMQDDLQKELLDIGGMIGGSLTVGSTHARSQVLLPAAFRAFQEKYPQVSVKLFEGSTDELENGIRNGTLDVSIGYLTEGSSQITTIPLYEENIIVVIPDTVIERYFPNHTILSTRKPDLSFVMSCLEHAVPGHDPDLENTYIYKTVSPVPEYIPEYFSGNEKCRNAAVLLFRRAGSIHFPRNLYHLFPI